MIQFDDCPQLENLLIRFVMVKVVFTTLSIKIRTGIIPTFVRDPSSRAVVVNMSAADRPPCTCYCKASADLKIYCPGLIF